MVIRSLEIWNWKPSLLDIEQNLEIWSIKEHEIGALTRNECLYRDKVYSNSKFLDTDN